LLRFALGDSHLAHQLGLFRFLDGELRQRSVQVEQFVGWFRADLGNVRRSSS
jgi:hypothetical protein